MSSILYSLIAGSIGLLIAHLLSQPEELRPLRLSQLILVPVAMAGAFYLLPRHAGRFNLGDLQNFIQYLAIAGFVALLLAPNIAYYLGVGVSHLIDPQDWTPLEEEIALRPVQKMIDRDQFQEALAELDMLLKTYKPTYEALLLKCKLLHHFSSTDETRATLLKMISLSHSTPQQLAVMEGLASLDNQHRGSAKPFIPKMRRLRIHHELILFLVGSNDLSLHKMVPPGEHEVQETVHGANRWLVLAGESWGNAEICWEAVQEMCPTKRSQSDRDFFSPITRMHRAVTNLIIGRPYFQLQAESKDLLKQANQFVKQENWEKALSLLQKASVCDPNSYEIAYRLIQVARHAESKENSARIVREVLNRSRWTANEQSMLLRN